MKNAHTHTFLLITILTLTFSRPVAVDAQVAVSGLLDYVISDATQEDVTNKTFRSFSNFHSLRTRLFFDSAPADNVEVFAQVLVDGYAFQLNGAYVRFSEITGSLNLQAGLIPATVGSWAPRTYSNRNPLIGVPLLYNYHTSYNPGRADSVRSAEDQIALRDKRQSSGLPIFYDACWNTGVEFYGASGALNYSVGLLAGSTSKPATSQSKNTPQLTTRLTYTANPGLILGGSAYIGPYLANGDFNDSLPQGAEAENLLSGGAGYELYYSSRFLEINSEGFYHYWEHPYLENLTALSGYIEGKYKFTPGWYFACRLGAHEPGKLRNAAGESVHWDYPVKRIEAGVGYKPNRVTTLKLVTQQNRFDFTDEFDSELYSLQISVLFE